MDKKNALRKRFACAGRFFAPQSVLISFRYFAGAPIFYPTRKSEIFPRGCDGSEGEGGHSCLLGRHSMRVRVPETVNFPRAAWGMNQ